MARRGTHVLDADFVVLDRWREPAERRAEITVHQQRGADRRERRNRQNRVAHPGVGGTNAKQRRGQNVEAVARTERLGLDQQPVQDHRDREAQQAEENAAVAREEKPEHQGDQGRGGHAGEHQREHFAHPELASEQARCVGADAVIERLAEGHQAAAQQNHQAKHHQALGERDGREEQHPLRKERTGGQQRGEDQPERERRAIRAQIFLASAMLNRPRGRNASTIAITR